MKKGARKFHRNLWTILGLLLPAVAIGAIYIKQSPPVDHRPVLLESPKEN